MSEETGYELDQEHFDKYIEALYLKMEEESVEQGDLIGMFEVMRRWWFIMSDDATVDAYVGAVKTAKLTAEKAEHEAAIAAIDEQLGA